MISEQQLMDYLAGALTPQECASLETELAGDFDAQRQLAGQQLMDQALRVALGASAADERVTNSVLAVVRGTAPEDLCAQVLSDTTEASCGASPSARSPQGRPGGEGRAWRDWLRGFRSLTRSEISKFGAIAAQLLADSPLRRYATATAAVLIVGGMSFYLFQLNRPAQAIEVGKCAAVTGSPVLRHLGERSTLHPWARQGKATAVVRSTPLHLGDRIETGDADKAEIQFYDGTTLCLSFNTTMEIPRTSVPQSTNPPIHQSINPAVPRPPAVKLLAGQVWAKVQKTTNQVRFAIQTPVATATVKGTEFSLKLQRTNSTALARRPSLLAAVLTVKEGAVIFANSHGQVEATAMTESFAQSDAAPTAPKRVANLKTFRLNRTQLSAWNARLSLEDSYRCLAYPVGWIGIGWVVNSQTTSATAPQPAQGSNGVSLSRVTPGSPADLAGVQVGDEIKAINGQVVSNSWQVQAAILPSLDRPIKLSLLRAGAERMISVTPTIAPDASPMPQVPTEVQVPLFQITWDVIAAGNQGRIAPGQASDEQTALELLLRAYPQAAVVHHNLAFVYEVKDEIDKAIRHYQRAVELDPGAALYHFNLGMALRSIGNLARAIEELEQAIELAPAWPSAAYRLSDVYTLVERYDDAMKVVDLGLERNPGYADLWRQKAEVLLRARRPEAALTAAQKALELNPALAIAYIVLGNIYHDLGRRDEAEAAQRKAIELGSHDGSAEVNLANLLRERGRLDEAEALYRKAIDLAPDDASALHGLGLVFFARRQAAEAEKWYRKAFELDPDSSLFCTSLGNVLRVRGQIDQSELLLRKALELDPENAEANVDLGVLCWQRKQWGEAERLILKAGALDPSMPVEQFLALVYRDQGKVEQQEQALRRWVARNPNNLEPRNELAWHLAERGIKLDEALGLATRAVELAPNDGLVMDTLGWVYYQRGELDQAESWVQKAIETYGQGPALTEMKGHLKAISKKKTNPK